MKSKSFSSRKYGEDKWQIVIVEVDEEDRAAITRFLKKVIQAKETREYFELMTVKKKKWEE